ASIDGGVVTIPASQTVTASGANAFTGGTVNGAGNLIVTGTMTWSGGSMTETGTTTIAAAGKITHGSATTFMATGRTLDVAGTLEITTTFGIAQSTAPAGLIHIEATGTLVKKTATGNA